MPTHFTPVASALGGGLIGLSAALLWLTQGRIAGISGIVAGLRWPNSTARAGLLAFVIGLIAAPRLLMAMGWPVEVVNTAGLARLMIAGVLVGYGTRLGGGCTSGHGVCGLARLSKRSMVATTLFMLTAGLVVFVMRHLVGG